MKEDWTKTAGLDQRLVERCQNLEARVKELETVRHRYHIMQESMDNVLCHKQLGAVIDDFKKRLEK